MNATSVEGKRSPVSESISLKKPAMSAKSSRAQRWIKRFVVAAIVLAVGSMVGVLATTPRPAEIGPAAVVAADEDTARRSWDAYAARYTGMAAHFSPREDALQRGRDACAARLTGLAEEYAAGSHSSQRAMNAYAARYTGIAEHFAATGK